MDQNKFLNKIKTQVLKEDENASLILFGSRARGDHQEDSDWDVLVITDKEVSARLKRKIYEDIYEVELEYMQPVSTIIFEKEKWDHMTTTPLYKNVVSEGRLL